MPKLTCSRLLLKHFTKSVESSVRSHEGLIRSHERAQSPSKQKRRREVSYALEAHTYFDGVEGTPNRKPPHLGFSTCFAIVPVTAAVFYCIFCLYSGISFFFVQNFVWKNYQLLLVESTSNFAWSLFWRKFTSREIYFCQIFSASKIFVKLLFIWAGLDVFPFKNDEKRSLPSCSAC